MPSQLRETRARRRSAIIAVLIGLSFATTLVVRIPIPATTGYFNIGDVFIILAGLWLGPGPGLLVGMIGPALADAIGYPQFILATAITKGAEGLVAGVVSRTVSKGVAAYAAAVVMCAGYFTFEAFVYPVLLGHIAFFNVTNLGAAIAELPFNLIQGFIGASVALGLLRAVPVTGQPATPAPPGES